MLAHEVSSFLFFGTVSACGRSQIKYFGTLCIYTLFHKFCEARQKLRGRANNRHAQQDDEVVRLLDTKPAETVKYVLRKRSFEMEIIGDEKKKKLENFT